MEARQKMAAAKEKSIDRLNQSTMSGIEAQKSKIQDLMTKLKGCNNAEEHPGPEKDDSKSCISKTTISNNF